MEERNVQETQVQENKMGVWPVNRLLISMSVPIMVSMLVQALYNVVDSIFVAKLSENALNAVSLAFPVQNLMIAVATGTGVGINALLSKSLGEKNFKRANLAAANGVFLAACSYIVFALLGVSVPGFALSILLILVLSLAFNYFPPLGYVGFFEDPLRNLQIMILPAILGVSISGSVMRMTRSSVLEVLRQDFIKTVRAKGASERVAIFKHALRNALIPIITLIGMQIGSLLGGAVIVEQIFSLPGLGQMTLTGINQRDYPVVQGCVLFIAFVYVLVNLVTDLLYAYIDPRISYD